MGVSNHVKDVCKIGQKAACCRYLVISAAGFECEKIGGLKEFLDRRVASGTIVARGDNCEGKTPDVLNAEK